jgi:hypothetical protein
MGVAICPDGAMKVASGVSTLSAGELASVGPLTFSGSCTGEAAPCTASPCWTKTLKYTVTNPGANDIAFTG